MQDTISCLTDASTRQTVRVTFWNVENLYDTYDDTTRLDDEFTSGGVMRWNYKRFHLKLNHIAKTILALGQWEPPAVIGLCEVENRFVMNRLIYDTPLKPYGYRMIHHESPDLRGIDVALLFRPSVFRVLCSKPFKISFPFDTSARTREILLIVGQVYDRDTLNILVNHWPSRRGGYSESQPRRDFVAGVLKRITDSLFEKHPGKKILVMGDFNDEPSSASIRDILHSVPPDSSGDPRDLINLMYPWTGRLGSHRYKGVWALLDQFMISKSLLRPTSGLRYVKGSVCIFRGSFLLKEDLKYFGDKPFRTYNGLRYEGGFSDHLPVYLDLSY
ncbi:MAG: endonuclease/exonuclease/phosphatase family protein [Bacteroidetes bacterium]|nr:endonuclease/exonuclease/phosphatase family protein [Bacteroidota bacterium]